MIHYHIVPFLDGYRIHKAITEIERVLANGRYRLRKVTRFEIESAATYPSRASAQAVLCKLAQF